MRVLAGGILLSAAVAGLGAAAPQRAEAVGLGRSTAAPSAAGVGGVATPLVGTFTITAGRCATLAGAPSGSYLTLAEHGVDLPNTGSACTGVNDTYTPLSPGSLGLVTGRYELQPVPNFASSGDSLATEIIRPVSFYGTDFGIETTCADQQHSPTPTGACLAGHHGYPPPSLFAEPPGTGGCSLTQVGLPSSGGTPGELHDCLYGNLSAVSVSWNGTKTCASAAGSGCYDQGAATSANLDTSACDAGNPTSDCGLSGTYTPSNPLQPQDGGTYSLTWHATIVGTAFNGAVGTYVLTGSFRPGAPATTSGGTGSGSSGSGGSGSGGSGKSPGSPHSSAPAGGASPAKHSAAPATVETLHGVLHIATGSCQGSATPAGSWLELEKGGGPIPNSSGSCAGGTYTMLSQGTTGLALGSFQPDPTPTFDSSGNSLANAVITPTAFDGTRFGAATDPQNEQDAPAGAAVFPAPVADVGSGGQLTANVSAVNFTYNGTPNATCASGSPPGDGCYAVGSSDASGTFNASTDAYSLSWSGDIHGGAFNGATAVFHLSGTFVGTITRVAASSVAGLPTATGAAVAPVGSASSAPRASSPAAASTSAAGPAAAPVIAGTPAGGASAPASPGATTRQAAASVTTAPASTTAPAIGAVALLVVDAGLAAWLGRRRWTRARPSG